MLLARRIRSYTYVDCFILHLTWGQTKRDMSTDNEEDVIQSSAFDRKLELGFRWPGHFSSVMVSCGNAVTITCFSPRMRKLQANGWRWDRWCSRDWRRAADSAKPLHRHRGMAGQHPAQHLWERAGGPMPPKSPQSPTITALPCWGHPEQRGNASLVRGCNCLSPVNVNMNHKATTALENYSSICCKIGDKANCVSVQSLLFLKESQIQNRVFSALIHSGLTFNLSVLSFQHNKNLYCLSENTMNLK